MALRWPDDAMAALIVPAWCATALLGNQRIDGSEQEDCQRKADGPQPDEPALGALPFRRAHRIDQIVLAEIVHVIRRRIGGARCDFVRRGAAIEVGDLV